ncbi:Cytochrome b561 and DOMON domain-containing protein [Actinidia chinensis var. chinensis]|uniref:Cytochrome b561 and DOMON domain-containing protein n=1 Tax=Actinidia chinensis var. chinensis TaxID=1590841 RepID=A0A2R6QFL9_ACTCC|nr:Cytochrome b561 and DOMON domain-containing protein [Actinidia chinensis var. chinensis]
MASIVANMHLPVLVNGRQPLLRTLGKFTVSATGDCPERRFSVAIDRTLAPERSCVPGESFKTGPSCQTWFTVVVFFGSSKVAKTTISLLEYVADRSETPKLKSPFCNWVR